MQTIQHNELIVPEAWQSYLPALDKITTFLDNEEDTLKQQGKHMSIFPPREQIFRALDCVGTPQNVKVVLLGQDPYIHPEQATGLAFGISNNTQKFPPSLRNILTKCNTTREQMDCTLEKWAYQGVLLLNTSLTVRQGESNSHSKVWKPITTHLLNMLSTTRNDNNTTPLVFMLWGGHALQYKKKLLLDNTHHKCICCSHPSPLSCSRGLQGYPAFLDDSYNCFDECNALLDEMGQTKIEWC